MVLLLFLLLVFIFILTAPAWPYSRRWGYGPVGFAGSALVLMLLASWLGVIAIHWPGGLW